MNPSPSFIHIISFSILVAFSVSAQSITRISHSYTAFTITEKDLLPESIAYDSIKNEFFIGSTRKGKIVKILRNGDLQDFILPKQHGLWMIIGIKADVERRNLWVCSSGGDNLEGYRFKDKNEGRPAGVFKFNLDTGKLIKKYVLDSPGKVHFFNDLVINKKGDVYITHMFSEPSIYKISTTENKLEKIFVFDNIKYPNGLALSNNESKLYVAHSDGISIINIPDYKIQPLKTPENIKVSKQESIDGLYFYNNSLIGIQPDINTVQQFTLDKLGINIISSKLLEVNHPVMNNPTTGEVIGNQLYYIANAQFGSFNDDGSLFPQEKLYETYILKLILE